MRRRSFFSLLAALPFIPAIARAETPPVEAARKSTLERCPNHTDSVPSMRRDPDGSTYCYACNTAVKEDIRRTQEMARCAEAGLPMPRMESTIYKADLLRAMSSLWQNNMAGLTRTVDARTRCLGVVCGRTVWWFPLTLARGEPGLHSWWSSLPMAS